MIRFVYSTTEGFYCDWQSHLLNHTFWEMGIAKWARCTRLVSTHEEGFKSCPTPDRIRTRVYAHDAGAQYVPLNRPGALCEWLFRETIEEPYVCILDPDFIFLKPFTIEDLILPEAGEVVGASIGYMDYDGPFKPLFQEFNLTEEHHASAVVPYIVRTDDLRRIAPVWLSETIRIRRAHPTEWCSEMISFLSALVVCGLRYRVDDSLVTCNHVLEDIDSKMLHSCYAFNNLDKTWTWYKLEGWGQRTAFPPELTPESIPANIPPAARLFFEAFFKHNTRLVTSSYP
jgi:hypothetical protein